MACFLVACAQEKPEPSSGTTVQPDVVLSCLIEDNSFAAAMVSDGILTPDTIDFAEAERQLDTANRRYYGRSLNIIEDALATAKAEGRVDLIEELQAYCDARAARGQLARFIEFELAKAAIDY
jgi:hypothetical protein